jgi:hypothetical protein
MAQKSTPHLRGNKEKEIINKTTIKEKEKEKEKRPYSSMTEINSSRNNIARIMIDDTGKIPKKTYVLNVRKLDRIQQNKRQRLLYSSNLEKNNPVQTNFNHNIIIIKNVTRELPTVLDIGEAGKLTHRYNYSSSTNISNIAHKIINESGKIVKKQREVSPRKNEVIRSFKKPLKLTYENYVETNTSSIDTGIRKIPVPKKNEILKTITNEKGGKISETKSSRIRKDETGNKTTTTTTTTTTTETKMRLGRNKTEANLNKEGAKGNKITTITKTEINTESKEGKGGRLQAGRSGRNIAENSGSTTEKQTTIKQSTRSKGGKAETITTKEVISEKSSRKGRKGGEGSGAEITKVTKTEITTDSSGENGGKSRTRIKKETSSITTTTKTVTKTSSSSEEKPVEGATVVKKFRSMRRMKK